MQSKELKTNNYFGLFEKKSKKLSNQICAATVQQKTFTWACAVDVTDRGGSRCNKGAMRARHINSHHFHTPWLFNVVFCEKYRNYLM